MVDVRTAVRAAAYRFAVPQTRECALCGHSVFRFLPYKGGSRAAPPLMRSMGMVGSDLDAFQCPWCGSHDRERHLFLFMNAVGLLQQLAGKRVLHCAPEKRSATRVAAARPAQHLKCDLFPSSPDVMKVDLLAMPFEASSFDLVIANHVMEHVADDEKALREVARVLSSGGQAILQTPFSSKLERSWSDPGIDSNEARLNAYGQEDHVRLYGRDIFEHFASFGLTSRVRSHRELLPAIDGRKHGVNEAEPFFLFEKVAQSTT